jgi:uncharacterized protein (DUF1800 family)
MPLPRLGHQAYWDQRNAILVKQDDQSSTDEVTASFWRMAISNQDQLRQRVTFALSEIFVVSLADSCGDLKNARSVSHFLDELNRLSFGHLLDVLSMVSLHPAMGCYLSHRGSRKEDPASGRMPDENYARELLQLLSVGLYQLDMDGSVRLDQAGEPIETYSQQDITGLARVMTGFSWACPMPRNERCFEEGINGLTGSSFPDRRVMPMVGYPQFHSRSSKHFLGHTIEADSGATPESELDAALRVIIKHPNVAPFISTQLIRKLVTSNPSKDYVARVAHRFKASDGDLGEVIKTILLDKEARDASFASSPTFGKVKEPVLRISSLLRAWGGASLTGDFLMRPTHDPGFGLAQSPMRSPSVFNFFRPGYVAPNSLMAQEQLVTPEMQLMTDVSAAGYVNYVRGLLEFGAGWNGHDRKTGPVDIQFNFNLNKTDEVLDLVTHADAFVQAINVRSFSGAMPEVLKQHLLTVMQHLNEPSHTEAEALTVKRRQIRGALLLVGASPEFIVQR